MTKKFKKAFSVKMLRSEVTSISCISRNINLMSLSTLWLKLKFKFALVRHD